MRRALSLASVVLGICLCCGSSALAAESQVITIAVLPFENLCKNAGFNWLGYGFAETLATNLSNISTIQLVERNELAKALKELKLQDTAVVDPKTAGKLGKIVGAKYVIIGSYQKVGDALKADARRVEVETSVASSGMDVTGKYSKVFSLQSELALKVAAALKKTPTKLESQAMAKPPTKSLTAYEWLAKGNEQRAKSDYDAAIACYSLAIATDATYAPAYWLRGMAYANKRDNDRAIADHDKAIAIAPSFAEPYFTRGNAYLNKGDYDHATADFDKAISIKPNFAEAYCNRGIGYAKKRDFDRAIADYDKAIAIDPNDANAYCNRGKAYLNKGDYDRATADFDKAIAISPSFAAAYFNRGMYYYVKRDYDRAIADYDMAIALDPKAADAYLGKGFAAFEAKRYREALETLRRGIEIAPASDPLVEIAQKMIKELEGK